MGSEPTTLSMKCFLLLLLPRYRHHQNIKAYFSSVFLPPKNYWQSETSLQSISSGSSFLFSSPFSGSWRTFQKFDLLSLSFSQAFALALSLSLFPWRSVSLFLSVVFTLSLSLSFSSSSSLQKKLTFDQNSFKLKILWARPNKLITSKAEAIKPN